MTIKMKAPHPHSLLLTLNSSKRGNKFSQCKVVTKYGNSAVIMNFSVCDLEEARSCGLFNLTRLSSISYTVHIVNDRSSSDISCGVICVVCVCVGGPLQRLMVLDTTLYKNA